MEMIHPTHDPRHMQVVVLDGDDFTIEEVVAVLVTTQRSSLLPSSSSE